MDGAYVGSKGWANKRLKYAISVLNGTSGMKATEKGRLHVVLILKEDLEEFGFWWQAWILECWIHRLQRAARADSPIERERGIHHG